MDTIIEEEPRIGNCGKILEFGWCEESSNIDNLCSTCPYQDPTINEAELEIDDEEEI